MRINSWMLCAAISLLSVAIIDAQVQERRGPGGVGRAYSIGDIVTIAADPAVQQELSLDRDSVAKVKAAQDAFVETLRERLPRGSMRYRIGVTDDGGIRNVQGPPIDSREAFKAAVDQYLKNLKDHLTADQYIRLQQIHWQVMGTSAFSEADVIETLMITKEQQQLIDSIKDEYNAKRQQIFDEARRSYSIQSGTAGKTCGIEQGAGSQDQRSTEEGPARSICGDARQSI